MGRDPRPARPLHHLQRHPEQVRLGHGQPRSRFTNARRVIALERNLGLFVEESIQDAFLGYRFFLQIWNVFYGTFHFWITGYALIYLFRKQPARYSLWRNTIIFATLLALIGFSWFPLMPPRLLDSCGQFGACASYGFVDTLASYGGLWSFDSGAMEQISNQYAAMPSLHFAWAMWTFLVLYPHMKHRWSKVLIAIYPWTTLFASIGTANHDALEDLGGPGRRLRHGLEPAGGLPPDPSPPGRDPGRDLR